MAAALVIAAALLAYPKPKEGRPIPRFTAISHENERLSSSDYAGQKLLLWFYPRAGTSGCTAEGRGFQENLEAFKAANVRVVGISNDKVPKNALFAEQNGFQFPLLCDTDNTVAMAFGAAQRRYDPHRRVAALIDEDGVLVKYYDPAGTADFAERVLADVQAGIFSSPKKLDDVDMDVDDTTSTVTDEL